MHVGLENSPKLDLSKYGDQLANHDQTKTKNSGVKAKQRSNSSPNIKFKAPQEPQNQEQIIGQKETKKPIQKATNAMDANSNSVMSLQMANIEQNNAPNKPKKLSKKELELAKQKKYNKNLNKFNRTKRTNKTRNRSLKAPYSPQSMAQVVDRLLSFQPSTPDEFAAALKGVKLEAGKTDARSVRDFCNIAAHCVRNTGAKGPERQQAIKALQAFILNQGKLEGYPKMDSAQVGFDLVQRIVSPKTLNQGPYGLCGPAAVAMHCAKEMPWAFANAAVQIARTGEGKLGNKPIKVRNSIRNHVPKAGISPGDWVVLSALSNESDVKKTDANKWGATGMGTVHNMLVDIGHPTVLTMPAYESNKSNSIAIYKGLSRNTKNPLKKALYRGFGHHHTSPTHHPTRPSFVAKGKHKGEYISTKNLDKAKEMLDNGMEVFMVVNEAMNPSALAKLEENKEIYSNMGPVANADAYGQNGNSKGITVKQQDPTYWKKPIEEIKADFVQKAINDHPVPQHWVLLTDVNRTDDGNVSISMMTYGDEVTMPPIPEKDFFKVYGGFVASSDRSVKDLEQGWNGANLNQANVSKNNFGWVASKKNSNSNSSNKNKNNGPMHNNGNSTSVNLSNSNAPVPTPNDENGSPVLSLNGGSSPLNNQNGNKTPAPKNSAKHNLNVSNELESDGHFDLPPSPKEEYFEAPPPDFKSKWMKSASPLYDGGPNSMQAKDYAERKANNEI